MKLLCMFGYHVPDPDPMWVVERVEGYRGCVSCRLCGKLLFDARLIAQRDGQITERTDES